MTLKTTNIPPRRTVESYTVFEAVNVQDPSDRLHVVAESELQAKIELIDKLGYVVQPISHGPGFALADVETNEHKAWLKSTTLDAALDEVLTAAKWRIQEPMQMVGGAINAGFNEVPFDDD
jgi:hypothetical protein